MSIRNGNLVVSDENLIEIYCTGTVIFREFKGRVGTLVLLDSVPNYFCTRETVAQCSDSSK